MKYQIRASVANIEKNQKLVTAYLANKDRDQKKSHLLTYNLQIVKTVIEIFRHLPFFLSSYITFCIMPRPLGSVCLW